MRSVALWFAAPRTIHFREEDLPAVGRNDVQVKAVCSAISHGTEMLVYRGLVPRDLPLDLPGLAGGFQFPIKYGYASVGAVMAVGPEVTDVGERDLVFALHPHQSDYVINRAEVSKLPAGVSAEAGVFVANLETACNVMLDAPVRLGETVVIFGQGVVGLLLSQLAKRNGAGTVVAVEPNAERGAMARTRGADVVLAGGSSVRDEVLDLTAGRGADVVIEASGAPDALQLAIDCAAPESEVIVVSWYGLKSVNLDLGSRFHRGRLRIRSSQVSRVDPALAPRWDVQRRRELALDLLPHLRLEELISHRVPFASAREAYELIDRRSAETVQVILTY